MEVLCCKAAKKKKDKKLKDIIEDNLSEKNEDSELYPNEFDKFDFTKLTEEENSSEKSEKSDEDNIQPTQG